jgi:hypothetical protein
MKHTIREVATARRIRQHWRSRASTELSPIPHSVVNGFVNETRRNGRDGVERGMMAGTGD